MMWRRIWGNDLNVRLNLYEMVHSNVESGAMAPDMAAGWLAGLPGWTCAPLARSYWAGARESYTPAFAQRVDASVETGDHTQRPVPKLPGHRASRQEVQ